MTIRARLATWYGALLALILLLFGLIINFGLQSRLMHNLDGELARQNAHLAEYVISLSASSPVSTADLTSRALRAFNAQGLFSQVLTPAGQSVSASPTLAGSIIPVTIAQLNETRKLGHMHFSTYAALTPGSMPQHLRIRLDLFGTKDNPASLILVTAASLQGIHSTLRQLAGFTIIAGLLSIVLAVGVGWALARSALQPVTNMIHTARAIADSRRFDQRVEGGDRGDELAQLTRTFNMMLDSLEQAYQLQRRFIADASHELRAPLTTIKGNLELLATPAAIQAEERDRVFADIQAEVNRLIRLVHELLELARADAGPTLAFADVELDRLVVDTARPYAAASPDRQIRFTRLEPVVLCADAGRLAQLFVILLDNALQYTGTDGLVEISVWEEQGAANLRVSDNGVGIAAQHLPHLFERFYRVDAARMRSGGSGLGLSIAKWIVDAHSGSIVVESKEGVGTAVTVQLPLKPPIKPSISHIEGNIEGNIEARPAAAS